ncbi:MAG: flippase, partial [Chloroflexota bacterium]
ALTDDRLHLLNVRYVISHRTTDISDVDGYTLAYEDEAVRVWENANAVPRALAPNIYDLAPDRLFLNAEIIRNTGRELIIASPVADVHTITISQNHFPGWRAYQATASGENELQIERISEIFTGINLLPNTVADTEFRVVYSPTSFQVGFFTSAIALLLALFLLGVWGWRRFVVSDDDDGAALLARNSAAPVILNLFNRGINFVFAFVMLRILGPGDAGVYYYAVIVFVWFDIFTNFGLDVYLTREVSRDRARGRYLLLNTTIFRLLLSVIGFGLLLAFIGARQNLVAEPFDARGVTALVLLYLGLIPGSLSKGMTSLYYAHERAEYPAAVSTVTTISTAVLGVMALLAGFGIIGLAAVSIFNNFVTLGILVVGGRDMFARPLPEPDTASVDGRLMRGMANESYPLMLNHFLATIFFQIDVVILEALRGAAIVGKYSVSYRWLLALNVIPAFFTMAIFPRLSKQAEEDRAALQRNYVLSLKMLVGVVFPAAVMLTFLAEPLTLLLGGQEFLPEGAIALQIMVWSMPFGWVNSLTQYLLIALNRQRQITWAFVVGVTFNVVTNLIFIPIYGFRAAAVTTILSEAILLVGFAVLLRRESFWVGWLALLWKPGLAAGAMSAAMALVWMLNPALSVMAGALAYPMVWWLLRPLDERELAVVRPLLPERVRQRLVTT